MKKIFILIAMLFTLNSLYAQNDVKAKLGKNKSEKKKLSPEEKAEKITNRLKSELSLTEEQTPKVKEITLERVKAKAAAKSKAGEDKKAFKAENKVIFQKWETSMLSILNQEQQKTYFIKKEEKKQAKDKKKSDKGADKIKEDPDDQDDDAGE